MNWTGHAPYHHRLMGINNRNLKTMEISLSVGASMLPRLPSDRIAVAESGLFTSDDLRYMAEHNARCFLIGRVFNASEDVTRLPKPFYLILCLYLLSLCQINSHILIKMVGLTW